MGNYRVGLKTTGKVRRARFGVWIIQAFGFIPPVLPLQTLSPVAQNWVLQQGTLIKIFPGGPAVGWSSAGGLEEELGGRKWEISPGKSQTGRQWPTQPQNPCFCLRFCVVAGEFGLAQSGFSGGDSDAFPGAPGADLGWDGMG